MTRPVVTTAADAVASALRAEILAGDPAPGDRLVEEVLTARFDVARHTVRAALRLLAAERLVTVAPHRGARVARIEGDDLVALFELRTALESEAVRLLILRRPGTVTEAVAEATAHLEQLCARDAPDRASIEEAHLRWHQSLVAAAGSPRITAAHAALALEHRLVLLQSRTALDPELMVRMHRELLTDVIRRGSDAVRDHLEHGRVLSVRPTPDPPTPDACQPDRD